MPDLLAQATANAALVTFLMYSVAVFALAYFAHRALQKKEFLGEYYLGSRGLGPIAFTLTFGATTASAGSFAGFPALIYSHGWILAVWISGYAIFALVSAGLLGKRLNQVSRKANAITLPDTLRARFDSTAVGMTATLVIIVFLSLYLIPQFKTASIILQQLFEGSALFDNATATMEGLRSAIPWLADVDGGYLLCLVIFAVLVIVYSTFGGFRAVVWTDVLQGTVMLAGVLLMLILALTQVGGLEQANQKLNRQTTPVVARCVVHLAEPAEENLRVPADTWFEIETGPEAGLYRSNTGIVIRQGESKSASAKVVRLTTPETIADVRSRFENNRPPALLAIAHRVEIVDAEEYAAGAKTTGVYTSGPGPSRSSLTGFLTLGGAVSFFLLFSLGGAGQPGNLVRLMAFDSSRTLKRSIAMLSVYFMMIYIPLLIIFCCARVLEPGLDATPDRIMPVMAGSLCDTAGVPWLAGLLVAAPFAAAMSTVDSFLLMISSSLVRDVYQSHINPEASERRVKIVSYACMLLVGIIVTIGAIKPPQLLQDMIVFASGGLGVAFLVPVGLAVYWKRFNTPAMLACMSAGLAAYTALYVAGFVMHGKIKSYAPLGIDAILWGFLVALVVGVAVCKGTRPPKSELVRKFF